jgi:hypothetical protein
MLRIQVFWYVTPCLWSEWIPTFEKLWARPSTVDLFGLSDTWRWTHGDYSKGLQPLIQRHGVTSRWAVVLTRLRCWLPVLNLIKIQLQQPKTSHKTTQHYTSLSPDFTPKTQFPYTRQKFSTAVHSPLTSIQTKRLRLRYNKKKEFPTVRKQTSPHISIT